MLRDLSSICANHNQTHSSHSYLLTYRAQAPQGEHKALMAVVCLSVCLSVCPVPDLSRKWKGVGSWQLPGKKPVKGDPWPHLQVERSKVKGTRPINAVTETEPEGLRTSNLVQWWVQWLTSQTCAVTSRLKALSGCSSHQLQGAGAYCGGITFSSTACLYFTIDQDGGNNTVALCHS